MTTEPETLKLRTQELRAEMQSLNTLADDFGRKLVTSMAGAVIQGRNLKDVFRSLALSMANRALSSALQPLGNLLGNALQQITPFAQGGIVNAPTVFPMRQGIGLMGEAGPEAILPLSRGSDGKLGIATPQSNSTKITVNISTPDAASFRSSQGQIASMIARAVTQGQRNL
jgi:phage-related minor tail protein